MNVPHHHVLTTVLAYNHNQEYINVFVPICIPEPNARLKYLYVDLIYAQIMVNVLKAQMVTHVIAYQVIQEQIVKQLLIYVLVIHVLMVDHAILKSTHTNAIVHQATVVPIVN